MNGRFWGIVVLCAAISSNPLAAQRLGTRLGVTVGLAYDLHRDRLVSPLKYGGAGVPIGLAFERAGATSRHEAAVVLTVNSLGPRVSGAHPASSHEAEHVLLTFGYAWARALGRAQAGRRTTCYLGLGWDNIFDLRIHDYGARLDKETFGEVSSSLHVRAIVERTYGSRHGARATFDFGVASLAFRNPWGISSDELGDVLIRNSYLKAFLQLASFKIPPEFITGRARLAHDLPLGSRTALTTTLDVRYRRFAEPEPSTTLRGDVSLMLAYVF